MSEINIPKIEKEDIAAPPIAPEGTAIVLQRHERYDRNRTADSAGSIFPEDAEGAFQRDLAFFKDVLSQEKEDGAEVKILFVSSDTQYAGKGYRSLETADVAQSAAIEALSSYGAQPTERIINFNDVFKTDRHEPTDQSIRPVKNLREPQIFDTPEYVKHLRQKYGAEDGPGAGISQAAWAAHESDAEKEVRESVGAEGVYDVVDRTKRQLAVLERYSSLFHAHNPNTRLVIWATSHYDTISPLVKDATGASFDDYVPVDYGAGVVMNIAPNSHEVTLTAQSERVVLKLGHDALNTTQQ